MAEEIIITVGPDGNTTIEVKGIKGAGCKALTAELEKSLGRVTKDTETEEMYATQRVAARSRS